MDLQSAAPRMLAGEVVVLRVGVDDESGVAHALSTSPAASTTGTHMRLTVGSCHHEALSVADPCGSRRVVRRRGGDDGRGPGGNWRGPKRPVETGHFGPRLVSCLAEQSYAVVQAPEGSWVAS